MAPVASLSDICDILPEIRGAITTGAPVVALESTIITHGMPFPQNLETAQAVEETVRNAGAVPATIAVLNGRLKIGLEADALARLANTRDAMKCSRADLAYAIAARRTASTTVAATMLAAASAGIEVFATGGIGGVHRGGEASLDISADLIELARSDVITICAGAKAILDLPKTLEVLETQGVPVIGYASDELPAFWSRDSGLKAPLRLDSAAQIAALWRARAALGQTGGMLVANPLPGDAEIPAAELAAHIEKANAEAEAQGIAGKAVTPFLLARMNELTDGRTLEANIALIGNNARLAAEIAVELSG